MNKFAWFKFYPEAFAASGSVEAMSTEAVGAYILLLCKAWHQSPPASLPNDDVILRAWSRTGERWSAIRAQVLLCWELRGDGRLYQPRLEHEWRSINTERAAKSKGGKHSAAKRSVQDTSKSLGRYLEDTSQDTCKTLGAIQKTELELEEETTTTPNPFKPPGDPTSPGEVGLVVAELRSAGFSAGAASKLARETTLSVREVQAIVEESKLPRVKKKLGFIANMLRECTALSKDPKPGDSFKAKWESRQAEKTGGAA